MTTSLSYANENEKQINETPVKSKNKLTLGVYGEAIYSRNFYSNSWKRYSYPDKYKNDDDNGQIDIPHAVIMIGYDFGNGWSYGSEFEFEHGGVETAMEIEEEETGEYESELEKGGGFECEQLWIQKSFNKAFNLRMGHIIVPVGLTNAHHEPDQFFGCFRSEGESTILPSTWHQTGVNLWGKLKRWKYQAILVPGLDCIMFDDGGWIHSGATSPYEFKIANNMAGAFRIDNYSIKNLRMAISGYYGKSGQNVLKTDQYKGIDGNIYIGTFDFTYNNSDLIIRGNFDYGHLEDSKKITEANLHNRQDSPSPKDKVASDAMCVNIEAGYNIFKFTKINKKFYLFGKYEYYDSMYKVEDGMVDDKRFERNCYSVGLNYYPIKEVIIKAEYKNRVFAKQYNNEPAVNIGVCFSGFLLK